MSSASFQYGGYSRPSSPPAPGDGLEIEFAPYTSEAQLPEMVHLIEKELSEPYLIYNYRYFLKQWPELCELVYARSPSGERVGGAIAVVVSKLEKHNKGQRKMRGYVAMLSVHTTWRGRGIARKLVQRNLATMVDHGAEEVVLETEVDNHAALTLYDSLNFLRDKRLHRFYLNGKDAFRLVFPVPQKDQHTAAAWREANAPKEPPAVLAAQQQLQTMLQTGAIA